MYSSAFTHVELLLVPHIIAEDYVIQLFSLCCSLHLIFNCFSSSGMKGPKEWNISLMSHKKS